MGARGIAKAYGAIGGRHTSGERYDPESLPLLEVAEFDSQGQWELHSDFRSELSRRRPTFHAKQFLQSTVEPAGEDFVELGHHLPQRGGDDDTVNCWCTSRDFINNQFKSVSTSSEPGISRGIEFRRSSSGRSPGLNWSTFSDCFRTAINSDPVSSGGRTNQ